MARSATAGASEFVNSGSSTIGGIYSDRRIYDRDKAPVVFLDSRTYPIVPAILAWSGDRSVTANKFETWLDQDEDLQFTPSQASGAIDGGTENLFYLSAASSRQWRVGDVGIIDGIWWNGTTAYTTEATAVAGGVAFHKERFIVTAIGAEGANTPITVSRESTTEVSTSMTLLKSGEAMADGWTPGTPFAIEPSNLYNVIQNFSVTYGVDTNRKAEKVYGEDDMTRYMRMKRQSFNRKLSTAMHFGVRTEATMANTRQKRQMGGMDEFIPIANTIEVGGAITIPLLNGYSETWFSRGSDTKFGFVGPTLATYIANLQIPTLRVNDKLSDFLGVPMVRTMDLTHGQLNLITDYSWTGTTEANNMRIYDLEYLSLAYLEGENIQIKENVQAPGAHEQINELYGSLSLWRTFAESHHKLLNVTG